MITEQATVIRSETGWVELEVQRQSVCGGCELNKGCGVGSIGRLLGNRNRPLKLPVKQEFEPGQKVNIQLQESAIVFASLIIYGLPLLGLFTFSILASAFNSNSEVIIVMVALTGFFGGYLCASSLAERLIKTRIHAQILCV